MNKIVKIFAVIFFIFMLGGCSNNTSVEDEILISEMETEEIDFIQNIEAQKIDRKLVHQTKIDERYREKHEKRLAYLNISFDYKY